MQSGFTHRRIPCEYRYYDKFKQFSGKLSTFLQAKGLARKLYDKCPR